MTNTKNQFIKIEGAQWVDQQININLGLHGLVLKPKSNQELKKMESSEGDSIEIIYYKNLNETFVTLSGGCSWDDYRKEIHITFKEAMEAKVGTVWHCYYGGNIIRGVTNQRLKKVSKKMFEKVSFGTADEPFQKKIESDSRFYLISKSH